MKENCVGKIMPVGLILLATWLTLPIFLVACGPPPEAATPTPIPLRTPTATSHSEAISFPTPTLNPVPIVSAPQISIPLTEDWQFFVDPQDLGEGEGWFKPEFDDSDWLPVDIPHTWNVMEEFYEYEGLAWYRYALSLPEYIPGANYRLRFEGVFYIARLWLNGEFIGEHEGGYTPFEFDVSGLINPDTQNVIAIQVDNLRQMDRIPARLGPDWSFDWWNYGGVVRGVLLEIHSNVYIAKQQIVAVPDLVGVNEADSASINIDVTVHNSSKQLFNGAISAEIFEGDSRRAIADSLALAEVSLPPGESIKVHITITLHNPRLWHFDDPNLYLLSTHLFLENDQELHVKEDTFGVRLIDISGAQFKFNGEPVRLVGLTRHADSPDFGLAETTTIMSADFDDLKRLNMVFSRPVHYPQSEYILDYCDRNGILLIPEVPSWQLRAAQLARPQMRALEKQQLKEMIESSFNHPSIWAWSIANEIDSDSNAGHEFVQEMISFVKSIDPTRPVGFASYNLYRHPQGDATKYSDFVMMNQYFGTWGGPKIHLDSALDDIHETWPDKVVIISEYGFEPRWNRWGPPTESLDPAEYYYVSENVSPTSESADEQRQKVIQEQTEVYRSKPYVVGAIFWTYQDYRTRTNFIMGVVDRDRHRRGSWYVLREEYSPILIEAVEFSETSLGDLTLKLSLQTRGPVESEMPAYTLRGYKLSVVTASRLGDTIFAEVSTDLPTLEPGSVWSGEITIASPHEDQSVIVRLIRPTGFTVIEKIYDAKGEILPAGSYEYKKEVEND
jgi:beta-glucuronidase